METWSFHPSPIPHNARSPPILSHDDSINHGDPGSGLYWALPDMACGEY